MQDFITDKYVNKRWVNPKLKADPAALYYQNRKQFDKYVKSLRGKEEESEEDSEDEEKERKEKEKRKQARKETKDQ